MLEIDGAYGEGGGQLARTAVALAALTGRGLRLANIRANRTRPGLRAQHLAALRAVAAMTGGGLAGAALGAREIEFRPGRIRGGEYRFEVGTAGSIALVLQAVLPVALRADASSRLTITGGTDVTNAPTLDYLRLVFLPWLADMGANLRIDAVRHGYYPRGGGEVCLTVAPAGRLRPLNVDSAGALRKIRGVCHAARLPMHVPERMAAAARGAMAGLGPTDIETRLLRNAEACGSGGALALVADRENCRLGTSVVAERGVTAEQLGREAGRMLRAELEAGSALDVHAGDQLLIYSALAAGESRFTLRELSLHARTVMHVIERFLAVRFGVEQRGGVMRIVTTPAG